MEEYGREREKVQMFVIIKTYIHSGTLMRSDYYWLLLTQYCLHKNCYIRSFILYIMLPAQNKKKTYTLKTFFGVIFPM